MPRSRLKPRDLLTALAEIFAPEIRNGFLDAMQQIADDVILRQMIDHVERGDFTVAFQMLGIREGALRSLTSALETSFERAGDMTGRTFPAYLNTSNGKTVFHFDIRNSRAEAFIRSQSAQLVADIAEDVRINVRSAIEIGIRDGRNPRAVALDIVGRFDPKTQQRTGGVIGLSRHQVGWVDSTRIKLQTLDPSYFKLSLRDKRFDSIVQKAIQSGTPLPAATIDRLVTRYKDRALKHRGDTIGRTEGNTALRRARWEAHMQAVDMGAVRVEQITRIWNTNDDGRQRFSHDKMDGQKRGLEEPFTTPSGFNLMFPGDSSLGAPADETILCRCGDDYKVDWLLGVT